MAEDHLIAPVGVTGVINMQSDMTVVAEAVNGLQAVERFREHRPDVTLLDVRMPKMPGIEAAKSHVKNIFRKLDVQDRTQAATIAFQRGIIHL